MRLTADGRFHLCLLRDDELDVRSALRSAEGRSRPIEAVKAVLRSAVASKPVGHLLADGVHARRRRMHSVGG
jgi:cyclic pyranopterin phosphate synthase